MVHLPPPTAQARKRINYWTLQLTYSGLLAEGPFSNQTELARHLGVSRVGASLVLKGIRRKTG